MFGIHVPRKRDTPADAAAGDAPPVRRRRRHGRRRAVRPMRRTARHERRGTVDLVLWHWLDRGCSRSRKCRKRATGRSAIWRSTAIEPKKFIRLSDEDLRSVTVAPKQRFAIGHDDREYELLGNLDGRRFQDVYVIDMTTGERKLALKRARWYNGPSPDGQSFLYYEDGNYHVYSMQSGQTRNITQGAAASFVDVEDDHNVVNPPTGTIGLEPRTARRCC